MSAAGPHAARIRERLRALKERGRLPGVVCLFDSGADNSIQSLSFEGESVEVLRCESVLALRDFIAERGRDGKTTVVVLTPVPQEELGEDVLARLAGRRQFRADSWAAVMIRFHAHSIDPRVVRQSWIADLLLEIPGNDFPAVPSGYLSIGTVWQTLLGRLLGLAEERPDALALLRWLVRPGSIERYAAMGENFRTGFGLWLEMVAGEVGVAIARCIETTRNADAVAIGLALDVLNRPGGDAQTQLGVCAARLERLHGGRPLSAGAAAAWTGAARQMVEESPESAAQWLNRADELLAGIGAAPYAHLGDLSPMGFAQRLDWYAGAIRSALRDGDIAAAEAAAGSLLQHREARVAPEVGKRIVMSRRLLRWLTGSRVQAAPSMSFTEAVLDYMAVGAWVDRARTALRGGEAAGTISQAYEEILQRARVEREKENERFGRLLADWNHGAPRTGAIVPVETVIEDVVAPLAQGLPVLMLVLDGLSLAIFQEAIESLAERGWTLFAHKPSGKKEPMPIMAGIAALPTITEVSRISLLAGVLAHGTSAAEKAAFTGNQFLAAVSRPNRPPRLFHKGELMAAGGTDLAPEVRDAIADREQRVIGVVINAVDDHLSGPEQVRPEWNLAYFSQHVTGLMNDAATAGRIVIFASDHGHVLDADTERRPNQYGERWRMADGEPGEGELLIEGGRLQPGIAARIVAPWSERIRYGGRKNGYHGGIAPQEVVVPVCVAGRAGTQVAGWMESWPASPSWWEEDSGAHGAAVQGTLFAREEETIAVPEWIGRLFKSRAYKSQKEALGRGAPSDNDVRELIEALVSRGGKLTVAAIAQRLKVPPVRVTGKVAAARRLLNLEGYAVLTHDYVSDTVELDIDTLRKQFEV